MKTTQAFLGATGNFYLPNSSSTELGSRDESHFIMLGSSGNGGTKEVDAGLMHDTRTESQGGWRPYLRTFPVTKEEVVFPRGSPVFGYDQYVIMYYAAHPHRTLPGFGKSSACLLTVETFDGQQSQSVGAFIGYKYNELARVKRTHSVAQPRFGVNPSGTRITGVQWEQGRLFTGDGGATSWSFSPEYENGSYPAKGAVVSWVEQSRYINEVNINIDTAP